MSSSSSSPGDSSSSDSIFDLLPDQTVLDKFEDYKIDLDEFRNQTVVKIDFSSKFMTVFALFQEALKRNELSERTLNLTKACIFLNPANYTIWYFRRLILFELNKDLNEEITFISKFTWIVKSVIQWITMVDYVVDQCDLMLILIYLSLSHLDNIIADNQKNYQIWQHRKCIVKRLKDASKEKEFTRHVLLNDSKNYHCWQYRQWFINKFNLLDGELEYTNNLLTVDLRNNSAWNHRYYVLDRLGKLANKDGAEFKSELEFVIDKIRLAPNNESSWNYLIGILGDKRLNEHQIVNEFIDELEKNGVLSAFYFSFRLDQLMLKLEKQADAETVERALQLTRSLATVHDRIREKYWNFIGQTIEKKYSKVDESV